MISEDPKLFVKFSHTFLTMLTQKTYYRRCNWVHSFAEGGDV